MVSHAAIINMMIRRMAQAIAIPNRNNVLNPKALEDYERKCSRDSGLIIELKSSCNSKAMFLERTW